MLTLGSGDQKSVVDNWLDYPEGKLKWLSEIIAGLRAEDKAREEHGRDHSLYYGLTWK